MRKTFSSTTGTIDAATGKLETTPILGAPFWQVGIKVSGIYVRSFETGVGTCHEFMAAVPIKVLVDGEGKIAPKGAKGAVEKTVTRFAMGALTGFEIAVQRLEGFDAWRYGDQMVLECINIQAAQVAGQSPMPMFKLDVSRP